MANFTAAVLACGPALRMLDRDQECLETVGNLLRGLGRWNDESEVRVFLKQVTVVVFGGEHPATLTSMNNLAEVLRQQGKCEEAEDYRQKSLAVR